MASSRFYLLHFNAIPRKRCFFFVIQTAEFFLAKLEMAKKLLDRDPRWDTSVKAHAIANFPVRFVCFTCLHHSVLPACDSVAPFRVEGPKDHL